jgi:hypothetical protein
MKATHFGASGIFHVYVAHADSKENGPTTVDYWVSNVVAVWRMWGYCEVSCAWTAVFVIHTYLHLPTASSVACWLLFKLYSLQLAYAIFRPPTAIISWYSCVLSTPPSNGSVTSTFQNPHDLPASLWRNCYEETPWHRVAHRTGWTSQHSPCWTTSCVGELVWQTCWLTCIISISYRC